MLQINGMYCAANITEIGQSLYKLQLYDEKRDAFSPQYTQCTNVYIDISEEELLKITKEENASIDWNDE